MTGKLWIATLGLGMVAGAATALMMPKHSEAYQVAQDAADTIKKGVTNMVDDMMQ